VAYCGDHVIQGANGETCDDATDGKTSCAYSGTNAPSNTCQVCINCQTQTVSGPYCGDAAVQATNGEQCDNGHALNGSTECPYGLTSCTVCTSTCQTANGTTFTSCGDGIL